MSATTLSGQERVNRAFTRQDQDRIPRFDSYWGETIERWANEGMGSGKTDAALARLRTDITMVGSCWPAPYPGQHQIIEEDQHTHVVRDGHGKLVRYWKHRSGTPEHLGFECDSRAKWEEKSKPALLKTGLQLDPAAVVRNYRRAREQGQWCCLVGVEPFEQTRALMGDEITLIAMAEDPQWIRDVARTFTTVVIQNFDAVMAQGIEPDGLWVFGDMAWRHATMCSPAMYRQLIWPEHKRLADWAHAHNMRMIYHTDGNINGVLDLYVEAGFDCVQPLEAKAGMDLRQLVPRYGDQLAFFGNIDVMVLATNDRDRIEQEVREKLAAGMSRRGYIYHSDHSVPPTVSWDTYTFLIDLLDRYGNYQ